MKVKAIKQAWYKMAIVQVGDIIDFEGKKLPSWAISCSADGEGSSLKNNELKIKVSELPSDQKTSLLEEAKAAGLSQNIDSWLVSTVKAKLETLKKELEKEKLEKLAELKDQAKELGYESKNENAQTIDEMIDELTEAVEFESLKVEAIKQGAVVTDEDTSETLRKKIEEKK